jgi:tryptophan-rich sensory protein
MKRFLWIVIAVMVCFAVGFSAKWFQADALVNWYPLLAKPSITPPNSVFPIAWGIIYLCMGVSVGLLQPVVRATRRVLLGVFVIQLVLNFLWSLTFFYLQSPLLGLINIIALDYVVLAYIDICRNVNKVAAWLFVPYALWLLFATYLNGYIYFAN